MSSIRHQCGGSRLECDGWLEWGKNVSVKTLQLTNENVHTYIIMPRNNKKWYKKLFLWCIYDANHSGVTCWTGIWKEWGKSSVIVGKQGCCTSTKIISFSCFFNFVVYLVLSKCLLSIFKFFLFLELGSSVCIQSYVCVGVYVCLCVCGDSFISHPCLCELCMFLYLCLFLCFVWICWTLRISAVFCLRAYFVYQRVRVCICNCVFVRCE